jgi:pimeloyl-ACP methyl ester carboxylesterase
MDCYRVKTRAPPTSGGGGTYVRPATYAVFHGDDIVAFQDKTPLKLTWKVPDVQLTRSVPLALPHGLSGTIEDWAETLLPLSRNRHVIAIVLLGRGKSKPACRLGCDGAFGGWSILVFSDAL